MSKITDATKEAWLKDRLSRIGASEASAAIGINSYDSQLRLWLTKTGRLPPKETNEAMEIGITLEPAIAELYKKRTKKEFAHEQIYFVSGKHPFVCGTLDMITTDGINVQIKNVGVQAAAKWGPADTDEIPHEVLVQVQQEMYVSGLELTHVTALIAGSELRIYPVTYNPALMSRIIELEHAFMEMVRNDTYPPIDHTRDLPLLSYLFTDVVGEREFDDEQTNWVESWEELGEQIKLLEKRRSDAKSRILEAIGEASRAKLTNGSMLVRSITQVAASVREIKAYSFPVLRVKS